MNGGEMVNGNEKPREIGLGRISYTNCFKVTEPDVDDEVTGEREAYMACVLAEYRKILAERTKHFLGNNYLFFYLSYYMLNIILRTTFIGNQST